MFRFSAAVIMSIVYDYEVAPGHDHLVELFERGNVLALESLVLETASIIEAFPFGKYSTLHHTPRAILTCVSALSLPEWLPGAVFRAKAAISKECATQMVEIPFEYAREREVKLHSLGFTAWTH